MSWQGSGQGAPPPIQSGWQMPEEPPGPAPGLVFGGFGERLIAYIVDLIVASVLVVGVVVGLLVTAAGATADSVFVTGSGILFIVFGAIVVSLAYFPWFWARDGATPGMRMMGLRVVRDVDGGPITGGQAVLRLIGYWVSGAVFYLGYVWILIDKRRRGWHDLIAGTVVVKRA